jgi:hypothetical protein
MESRGLPPDVSSREGKESLSPAAEREVIEAREEVVLRVGDPAALMFHINEMPGRPLGRAGQPITVRITPQNYHEFVGP